VTLTLAGPQRLNALSAGLNVQLQDRLDEIARDPTIRSVVITGEDAEANRFSTEALGTAAASS
jgi:enoyl-CoA hydratase/carnithine racemase